MQYNWPIRPIPRETNPAIRNSLQRVLAIGADNEIVSKILLTAENLCKAAYLSNTFAENRAWGTSLAADG